MIKLFFKAYASFLIFMAAILFVIYLMFILFNLSLSIFSLLVGLILILLGIYLSKQAIYFKEQKDLELEVDQLNQQIIQLNHKTEESQQELEEYFIMWVHQMKTPITASQLLLDNADFETAGDLRQELLQIENYTNMALNYLKLTHPDTDMVISQRVLHDLIAPLLRKYRIQFIQNKISLHYQPIQAVVVTEANLSSLMIEQLLNNALKYAKGKDIFITFNEVSYELLIEDSGPGIRSEDIPKIFDKGYSGFNGQLNQKSSGLGLYIVNLIAHRLDQPVRVQSNKGEKTSFAIKFHKEAFYLNVIYD